MLEFLSWVWWLLTNLLWIGFWLLLIGVVIVFLARIAAMIGEEVLPPVGKALGAGIEATALLLRMIVGDIAAAVARWWRRLCAEFIDDCGSRCARRRRACTPLSIVSVSAGRPSTARASSKNRNKRKNGRT